MALQKCSPSAWPVSVLWDAKNFGSEALSLFQVQILGYPETQNFRRSGLGFSIHVRNLPHRLFGFGLGS